MSLHFIMAGRELAEPVHMEEALALVIHGRPSADAHVFQRDGELRVTNPWKTEAEWSEKIATFAFATLVLHRRLAEGHLTTYVQNPASGAYMRVPRLYWNGHPLAGPYEIGAVEDATGWDDAMKGCPILVASDHLPAWREAAQAAISGMVGLPKLEEAPKTRNRAPTKAMQELATFLRLADDNPAYQDMAGPVLLGRYMSWAAKPGRAAPLSRSRFYELLEKHRRGGG